MYQVTGIEDFDLTKETCFVCGRPGLTKEHVFPKWLQRKFNLWNEMLILPNGSKIPYRKIKVPCCQRCNGISFSNLENKFASGKETEEDIWKWANKVHFALTLRDQFTEWDYKNRGYTIGEVISPSDPLEQSRHFLHCVSGDFKTDPTPFGSVFRFDFTQKEEYNFIHIINSNSICICLEDRGYVVFIRDGQFFKENNITVKHYAKIRNQPKITMYDMLFFFACNIEYLERYKLRFPVIIGKGFINRVGEHESSEEKEPNNELLKEICNHFGITLISPEESNK